MIKFEYESPNYFETVYAFHKIIEKLKEIGVNTHCSQSGFRVSAPFEKEFNTELYETPQQLVSYYHGIMDGVNYQKFQETTKKPDIWSKKDWMQK